MIYSYIEDTILSLMPSELTTSQQALANLITYTLFVLCIVAMVKFILWLFGLFSNLGR